MTKRLYVLLTLFLTIVTFACAHVQDPRRMNFPPIDFHPPEAERRVLDNGMVLYLLEDHELPLVDISAMIRTGSIYEPSDKIGLAGLTGHLMRTGGAGSLTGDQLDEELEFMAADIGSGVGEDSGFASLSVLKKDFDRGLRLFADVLMHPRFAEDKLALAKQQTIEGIRRRNDNPHGIASREFRKLLYGPTSPFAYEATIKTVHNIQREDIVAFHEKYYHPNQMIIGITGDFNKDEMTEKIRQTFAGWKKSDMTLPRIPPVKEVYNPSVNLVQKDLTQATVRIGHLSIRHDNPDFFALSILDDILGGEAFASRLFRDVRAEKGLAYSAGTALRPGNLDYGIFVAYCDTKTASTRQAIAAIIDNIRRIREEPVSDEELQLAKESFLNSFVFSFSDSSQIVNRQMSLEYYGLPKDFLQKYRDEVVRVTKEDLLRVGRKYLHPDGMIILTIGPADVAQQLSVFGPVNKIPLESPEG
jgi:zinc protease